MIKLVKPSLKCDTDRETMEWERSMSDACVRKEDRNCYWKQKQRGHKNIGTFVHSLLAMEANGRRRRS